MPTADLRNLTVEYLRLRARPDYYLSPDDRDRLKEVDEELRTVSGAVALDELLRNEAGRVRAALKGER